MKNITKSAISLLLTYIIVFGSCATGLNLKETTPSEKKLEIDKIIIPTSDDITWIKTFGGLESDEGKTIHQTSDGGYIIFGTTASYGPGTRAGWLIKTDAFGNEKWTKTYGGPGAQGIFDGQLTSDGGYIFTGFTDPSFSENADVWVVKTDGFGNEEWSNTFGGLGIDMGFFVIQTNDEGYIIGASIESFGNDNSWLIKIDSDGNEEWNRTFSELIAHGIQIYDGGFIFTGSVDTSAPFEDAWLAKTDGFGNEEWSKTFGGSDFDGGAYVQQTTDGGYIIIGSTYSFEIGLGPTWVIKTDELGNEEWNKTYFGSAGSVSIKETSDGGYVFIDGTSYDLGNVRIVKINKNGRIQWISKLGTHNLDWGVFIQQTQDDGFIIVGGTEAEQGIWYDILVIKTNKYGKANNLSSLITNIFLQELLQQIRQHSSNPLLMQLLVRFPILNYA